MSESHDVTDNSVENVRPDENHNANSSTQDHIIMDAQPNASNSSRDGQFKKEKPNAIDTLEASASELSAVITGIEQQLKIQENQDVTSTQDTASISTLKQFTPKLMNVNSQTKVNRYTALTIACAGGHDELVEYLLARGSNIEHRDIKYHTPLMIAASKGFHKIVEILLNNNCNIDAQTDITKETALILACSENHYKVCEMLLQKGANKEHRTASNMTPLIIAASFGYTNIIELLLNNGAEINSWISITTGISPLMLAAMHGHTAAVKLLLDKGSDINATIKENLHSALTLASNNNKLEVVSLLLERKANKEHRSVGGFTPLMEAANGGFVEVGRLLIDKGANINAKSVSLYQETALTIAAHMGHQHFVKLLLEKSAKFEIKNKKGCSPLWLAASGGHLPVVKLLYDVGANIDFYDNKNVSCLMAAFRNGHVDVVKWMLNHVSQFPNDKEMTRFISTLDNKESIERCQECMIVIKESIDQQAAKAFDNSRELLEEHDLGKTKKQQKKKTVTEKMESTMKKKTRKRNKKNNN